VTTTIWQYGVEGSYHDGSCPCADHCLNCFDDLPTTREVRAAMIARGVTSVPPLGPRERYCSPYCRNRAKRDRALSRALAAMPIVRS
jgi:hypothetical protein